MLVSGTGRIWGAKYDRTTSAVLFTIKVDLKASTMNIYLLSGEIVV